MTEIWFARRYPLGNPRNSMAPVHWKGWLIAGTFVAAILFGGIGFLLSSLNGKPLMGLLVFVSLTAIGAGMFIMSTVSHGDQTKTVADYRTKNA